MGAFRKKVLTVLIAFVMVMTSAVGVFAAAEPGSDIHGETSTSSVASVSKGTVTVEAGIAKTSKGKVSEDGTTVTGLKSGQTVTITTTSGDKIYRWMKSVKITSTKGKTVKWKKVKGATKYMIKIYDKNGKFVTTLKTKGTKISSKKYIKKGYKVKVRPIKGKYVGSLCKTKKVN